MTGPQGRFNAIGFRELDGYIYGLSSDEDLIRIDSTGLIETLGPVSGLPANSGFYAAGTVGPNGLYYVLSEGNGSRAIHVINLDTRQVINNISRPNNFNAADFVIDAQMQFAYLIIRL